MTNLPKEQIELILEIATRLQSVIWIGIPIWFFMFVVKDKIILIVKRLSLMMSLILAMDNFYEINGKQGKLTHFGWRRITLQDHDGRNHYIPMELAVRSTITRLDGLNGFYDGKKNRRKKR